MKYDSTFSKMENSVKLEELATAISRRISKMDDETAYRMAEIVMNFVGYNLWVLDNWLEKDERDVFYMLENCRLVSGRREEIQLMDGKLWRIYTWHLNTKEIKKAAQEPPHQKSTLDKYNNLSNFYESLAEEVWARA